MFNFGSVCSGIDAASVALLPLGCKAEWFAEIDEFPSAVLAHHYQDVSNLGDMTLIKDMVMQGIISAPDVLVGGTPCQSFSVAGARQGLEDDRGQLSLEFVRLANAIDNVRFRQGKRSGIVWWENVPGVLSSKDNAFGCFLAALAGEDEELKPTGKRWSNAGCVFGPQRTVAWRLLDAQYFGVAQRRRRLFVIASSRDGFNPAKVLFEFDGVRRDIAPSRKQGQEAAGNSGSGIKAASHLDGLNNPHPTLSQSHNTGGIGSSNQEVFSQRGAGLVSQGFRKLTFESYAQDETASTMMARDYKSYTDLVAFGIPGNWIGRKPENGGNSTQFMHEIAANQTATDRHGVVAISQFGNIAGTLTARHDSSACADRGQNVVAFNSRQDPVSGDVFGSLDSSSPQAQAIAWDEELNARTEIAGTLLRGGQGGRHDGVMTKTSVRRLTPIECERLQGFPDNYTRIPYRGKDAELCPDGHRYKALGNSMAVPVMQWIGKRLINEMKLSG